MSHTESEPSTFTVTFEPWGKVAEVEDGRSLLEAARAAEVPLGALCGGRGTCGKCRVRVLKGRAGPVTKAERGALSPALLGRGERLACMVKVLDSLAVETLLVSAFGKRDAAAQTPVSPFAPPVRRFFVSVSPPTLESPLDDAASLQEALLRAGAGRITGIDFRVLQELPETLRSSQWRVAASVRSGELIAARPGAGKLGPGSARPSLGMAVDLGTTTIAASLHGLEDASLFGVFTAANPLVAYGADIITRLVHAQAAPANGANLQKILVKAVNALAERAVEEQGLSVEDIEEMVVVGNSGMHHLFLNLPSRQLTNAPFVPAERGELSLKARELGLTISPGAYLYAPALVGGFIGSDLLAVALVTRLDEKPGNRLALDIGTNTELLLSANRRLTSCSTASGPALEGGALKFGTMAMPGAIDAVRVSDDGAHLVCHTIGDVPALGICGSGIIDALACLLKVGAVNRSGRLQEGATGVLSGADGDHRYLLVPAQETSLGTDITISQTDIRAIQLAKGAIRAGIDALLARAGLEPEALAEILIAGAFGSRISVDSALRIGLLPPVPADRVRQIGNAAGSGAGLMLVSEPERAAASRLSGQIERLELSREPEFPSRFARAQWFPSEER